MLGGFLESASYSEHSFFIEKWVKFKERASPLQLFISVVGILAILEHAIFAADVLEYLNLLLKIPILYWLDDYFFCWAHFFNGRGTRNTSWNVLFVGTVLFNHSLNTHDASFQKHRAYSENAHREMFFVICLLFVCCHVVINYTLHTVVSFLCLLCNAFEWYTTKNPTSHLYLSV